MSASRPRAPVRRQPGFSLVELVVVVALIGILIAVATSRLVPYIAQAERVAVVRIEGQLRNVLMMEAALMIARGRSAQIVDLDRTNPMALVLEPPRTYLGELNSPTLDLLPPRSWYFDKSRQRLVYRAGRGFEGSDGAPVLHEYSVTIEFGDSDGDRRFTAGTDEFFGVRLTRAAQQHGA